MQFQKIRLHNYLTGEEEETEALKPPRDRYFYAVIVLGVLLFFGITYPYRDISIPSSALALFGFVVMCALVSLSWLRPQYYWASIAFCIYIPFSGEYPGDFGQQILGVNFTNILFIPLLLQWIMQRPFLNERLVRLHAPDLPLLIFCALSTFSLLRVGMLAEHADFGFELRRLYRWLMPFVAYFLFVNIARNEKGVQYLVVTMCVAITAIAILVMKESFDIGPGGTWDRLRVRSVLRDPNATGAFFVYYTLIFLGFFLCNWRDKRYWLLLIPFLLCGRAMTLANSRGGMIAFTLAMLATLFVRSKWLFLLGVLVIGLGLKYPQYLPETISGRLIYGTFREIPGTGQAGDYQISNLPQQLDPSSAGRLAIWMAGWDLFLERPWLGHGYGEFPRQIGRINPVVGRRDPHNTYLGIAVEMGVFAVFFFIVAWLFVLRSCWHVYRQAPDTFMQAVGLAGVGMMFGALSANFFGSRHDTLELTAYLWILSAIIVQYDKELRSRVHEEAEEEGRIIADPWARVEEAEEL